MKYFFALVYIAVLTGCNQGQNNKPVPDSAAITPDSIVKINPPANTLVHDDDTVLLNLSKNILTSLKKRDYSQLTPFIHPSVGIRISPYGYIDTVSDKVFSREEFAKMVAQKEKIHWGVFDGSEEPIILSWTDYQKRFIYDKDFLNASQHSVDSFLVGGNTLNNLNKVYTGCHFTEFYFRGTDPKFDGMDWKTLRLVYKKENNDYYLVGIVHDEWTI